MKRLLTAVAASLMLIATLAGPVAAAGPGCSDFGAGTAGFAHAGGFGQMISGIAPSGAFAPIGTGTYRISDIVAWEHSFMCTHP